MKKIKLIVAVIFALSVVGVFAGASCEEDNGQTMHTVSWTAPSGLYVAATSDNEVLVNGGYIQQGSDVLFAWTGVLTGFQIEIHRGTVRLHYFAGNANWTLSNIIANQNLVFTVASIAGNGNVDCAACNDSGEHCVECCDDADCVVCNENKPDCTVCNDSGEHCSECCDDLTCDICNGAYIDIRFLGDYGSGLNSWDLYDSEGNRIDTNSVSGAQRAAVLIGDTVSLRWNMNIIDYRITMRFVGTLILMTTVAGNVQNRHASVLNTGNDWSFTFEVLPMHSVYPGSITMDFRYN